MRKYSFLNAIYLSFFSKDFYCDVLQNRKGLGFLYLFFISFIASLIVVSLFVFKVRDFDSQKTVDELAAKISSSEHTFEDNLNRVLDVISQIPRVTFENGQLSTNKQEPYYITDPVSGKNIVIFDTSGYYNGLEKTDAVMLFTKTKIITKKNNRTEQAHYVSEMTAEQGSEEDLNAMFTILSQIPKITIKNGIASIEESVPYNIVDKEGSPLVIIDTDGNYESIEDNGTLLLITEDRILIKDAFATPQDENVVKEVFIADINEDMIYTFILEFSDAVRNFLFWFIPLVVLPLYTMFSFVLSLIVILLISLITLLFGKVLKLKDFEYENALRVSSFAFTPVLIVSKILPDTLQNQNLIYFLILLGYLYFAVYANLRK
ncbi:MAG: hypothetical protein COV35_06320 [Alphaproteobacteria bacterium CG11_big_fil_rev_8_21_14_0_20_39_49]|nr:MAG: hypothetical protein COV35_06320 [Alphaproteobacteria bacterium CG11_big_fil_rev_8_21_14_0_20_39_49]